MATQYFREGSYLKARIELSGQKFKIKAQRITVEGQSVIKVWNLIQREIIEVIDKTLYPESKIKVVNKKFNKISICPDVQEETQVKDESEFSMSKREYSNTVFSNRTETDEGKKFASVNGTEDDAERNLNQRQSSKEDQHRKQTSPRQQKDSGDCSDEECSNCSSTEDNGGRSSEEGDKWSLESIQNKQKGLEQEKMRFESGTYDNVLYGNKVPLNPDDNDSKSHRKDDKRNEGIDYGHNDNKNGYQSNLQPHKPTPTYSRQEYPENLKKEAIRIKQEPREIPEDTIKFNRPDSLSAREEYEDSLRFDKQYSQEPQGAFEESRHHKKSGIEIKKEKHISPSHDIMERSKEKMTKDDNGHRQPKDVYNKDYAIKSSFAHPRPSKEEKVQCQPDMYRPFNEDMTEDMEEIEDEDENRVEVADMGSKPSNIKREHNSVTNLKIESVKSLPIMNREDGSYEDTKVLSSNGKIANRCPFSPYCSKVFGNKSNVERHVKTVHQKAKDYTCTRDGCNMAFAAKSNLLRHIGNIHEKKNSWKCGQCREAFNNKQHLDIHVKYVHQQYISQNLVPNDKSKIDEQEKFSNSTSQSIHRVKRKKHKRSREEYDYYKRSPESSGSEVEDSFNIKSEKANRSDSQNEDSVYKQDNPWFHRFVKMQEQALHAHMKNGNKSEETSNSDERITETHRERHHDSKLKHHLSIPTTREDKVSYNYQNIQDHHRYTQDNGSMKYDRYRS